MKRLLVVSVASLATLLPHVAQGQKLVPNEAIEKFPAGGAGYMAVTDLSPGFEVTEPVENVAILIEDIASGGVEAEVYSKQVQVADVGDFNQNGGVLAAPWFPTPISDEVGAASDDFIEIWRAYLKVDEPGEYTFQIQSDDGFAFEILGQEWIETTGNGNNDGQHIFHTNNTGNSNTRGLINLPAGIHELQGYWWERGGGAFGEIATAKGNFIESVAGARWLGLGDGRVLPEEVAPGSIAQLNGPLFAGTSASGEIGATVAETRELLVELLADGSLDAESNDAEYLVFDDDRGDQTGCPFGDRPDARAMLGDDVPRLPNSDLGDVNDFGSLILGSLTIDDGDDIEGEMQDIIFHIDSDDRALFRIIGQSFTDVAGGLLEEVEGDMVISNDAAACIVTTTGQIQLQEGSYDFEAVLHEQGGDTGIQILSTVGTLDSYLVPSLQALSTELVRSEVEVARNVGIAFVDPNAGLVGDFNMNGVLDAPDIDDLTKQSADGMNLAAYDLNADSLVNDADIRVWVKDLKNTWIGDADLNGEFNSGDLVVVLQAGTYETGVASVWSTGDFNGDGITNTGDLVAALQDGGYEIGPRAAVAAVPEPSGLLLVLVGALAAVGSARRRTR